MKGLSLGNSGISIIEDTGKRKNVNNLTMWGVASVTPHGTGRPPNIKQWMQRLHITSTTI